MKIIFHFLAKEKLFFERFRIGKRWDKFLETLISFFFNFFLSSTPFRKKAYASVSEGSRTRNSMRIIVWEILVKKYSIGQQRKWENHIVYRRTSTVWHWKIQLVSYSDQNIMSVLLNNLPIRSAIWTLIKFYVNHISYNEYNWNH